MAKQQAKTTAAKNEVAKEEVKEVKAPVAKKTVKKIKNISAEAWAKSVGLNGRAVFFCKSKLFAGQLKPASEWETIMKGHKLI